MNSSVANLFGSGTPKIGTPITKLSTHSAANKVAEETEITMCFRLVK